jgi:hypothetical protein
MSKTASPFAGLKLSEPVTSAPGTDQRLFTVRPTAATPRPQPNTALLPSEPAKEARKQGTLEPRSDRATNAKAAAGTEPSAIFDITIPAYQNNTYAFTAEELWAIEDTKQALERTHNLKVTKYNLIRLGVHLLIEDFRRKHGDSFAVKRLRAQQK